MRQEKIFTLFAAVVLLMGMACKGRGPTKQDRIDAFNEAGWTSMEDGNFEEAYQEFLSAVGLDSNDVEANVGLGWSLILTGDPALSKAVNALEKGTTSSSWQQDSWAGLAVVRLSQQEYWKADSLAGLVLAADASFTLDFYPLVDWRDLLVIQAQSLFFLGSYSLAWQAVQPLLSETTDLRVGVPEGNLDPGSPATWIVNGTTFALYEAALAEVIGILTNKYRQQ